MNTALGEGSHHTLADEHVRAVALAGAAGVVLPNQPPEHATDVISVLDAVIISGGGDVDPAAYGQDNHHSSDVDRGRDEWEIALVRAAEGSGTPLLGICRGLQILNVAKGGTLDQHIWERASHPALERFADGSLTSSDHDVTLDPTSTLALALGHTTVAVNSYHHQAIESLGRGLVVVGRSPDDTIEAVETVDRRMLGVQWHPELLDPSHHQSLLKAFLNLD